VYWNAEAELLGSLAKLTTSSQAWRNLAMPSRTRCRHGHIIKDRLGGFKNFLEKGNGGVALIAAGSEEHRLFFLHDDVPERLQIP